MLAHELLEHPMPESPSIEQQSSIATKLGEQLSARSKACEELAAQQMKLVELAANRAAEVSALQKRCQELEEKLDDRHQDMAILSRRVLELEDSAAENADRQKQLEATIEAREQQLSGSTRELNEARERLDAEQKAVAGSRAEYDSLSTELAEVRKQLVAREQANAEAKRTVAKLHAQVESLTAEAADLQHRIKVGSQQFDRERARNEELGAECRQVRQARDRDATLLSHVQASLQHAVARLQHENGMLRRHVDLVSARAQQAAEAGVGARLKQALGRQEGVVPAPPLELWPGNRAREQIEQCKWFDRDWYAERHLSAAPASTDPALHYLMTGAYLGFDPGPEFSTIGYLQANPDVALSGLNPLMHFIKHGEAEGRGWVPQKAGHDGQA